MLKNLRLLGLASLKLKCSIFTFSLRDSLTYTQCGTRLLKRLSLRTVTVAGVGS